MSGNILADIENGSTTQSIYIHIPFCTKKCPYCHFYVVKEADYKRSELQKEALLQGLISEIDLVKDSFSPTKKIVSIYWGGGTPSLFGPKRVATFHHWLYKAFASLIDEEIEITLEVNPDSLSQSLLQEYKAAGINRISMGVQSFHDEELLLLGRAHNGKKVYQAIEWSLEAELHNISIDLMYDLPSQSLQRWEENLALAFSLPITHLSLYNLTIEPNTQFFRRREELEEKKPSDEMSRDMYLAAQKIAKSYEFEQYEISAFKKEGYHSKHNTGYWIGRDFYGFGPSAYSFMNGIRFSNVANINRYIKSADLKALQYENIDDVSPQKRVRELFCIGLRLFSGVSLTDLIDRYSASLDDDFYRELRKFLVMQYIFEEKDRYKLTKDGILVYDTIASALI